MGFYVGFSQGFSLIYAFLISILLVYTPEAKHIDLLMPDVVPVKKDTYLCSSFPLDPYHSQYIVEFRPNASMATAHHILIYGCTEPGYAERDTPRAVWDCGEMSGSNSGFISRPTCQTGSQIIYAWAMDAPALKLPEGVGFKIGGKTGINYLVLQVHYASVDAFKHGVVDRSGIVLSVLPGKTDLVSKDAGVYLLGTSGRILANKTEHMETACTIRERVVLHPFAFRTHTHKLGKAVSGYVIRGDTEEWELIGKHDPQQPQMFYPVENKNLVIRPGDVLAARCTMYNFRNHVVSVGSTTEDEMCNFYMMYYVEGHDILQEKYCFSAGPPYYYWISDRQIPMVPKEVNVDASTLN